MADRVAIVDSGGANIASLRFALQRLGVDAALTTDASRIRNAERVILPGVGAAADAMERLHNLQLAALIPSLDQPVLGICLGMQLLAGASDEGDTHCLGVLPSAANRLVGGVDTPVPHMGWSRVHKRRDHPILDGLSDDSWFYFVHSYALPVDQYSIATANHGKAFSAVAAKENFCAAQFHPERSAAAGSRLLKNFLTLCQ